MVRSSDSYVHFHDAKEQITARLMLCNVWKNIYVLTFMKKWKPKWGYFVTVTMILGLNESVEVYCIHSTENVLENIRSQFKFSANINRYGKMQTNCIFSAPILITPRVWLCILSVFMCFITILSSSLNTVLIVDKHCSDVCYDEFPVPQTDRNSKQVKEQWHNFICNQYGKNCPS